MQPKIDANYFKNLIAMPTEKYRIDDRKIRFFYHRFVEGLGNVVSIKKSIESLALTTLEIKDLCEKISENVSGKRKYRIMI